MHHIIAINWGTKQGCGCSAEEKGVMLKKTLLGWGPDTRIAGSARERLPAHNTGVEASLKVWLATLLERGRCLKPGVKTKKTSAAVGASTNYIVEQ